MNDELRALLADVGLPDVGHEDAWDRVVVVRNYGRVPPMPGVPPESSIKGFKLLLLDRRRRPAWFGRCGWAGDAAMVRESALLGTLAGDAAARRNLPEVRSATGPRLHLQVSRYLGTRSFARIQRRQRIGAWVRCVSEIIAVARQVADRATEVVPDLAAMARPEVRRASLETDLRRLEERGIAPATLRVLRSPLELAMALPPRLQHGDLWPSNVLRKSGTWWLIDFAEFGAVWTPMYDVFHMLKLAPDRAGSDAWYASLGASRREPWTRARGAVLTPVAAREGLAPVQAGAAFVRYLVHLAAYRLRPGVPRKYSDALVSEIQRVAEFLGGEGTLETLLPLGPP